jgi:hypothetical protein
VVTKSAGDGSSVVIINNYDPCVGLYALQRGAGTAIRVDSSATSSNIISVLSTVSSTGNAIDINVKGSGGTGGGFGIHVQQRGEAQALYLEKVGTGVVDCMHVANEGFGAGIRVNQSNTSGLSVGIQVDQRGAGYCYYANKLHGGADPAIAINNAGTGKDIYGNGGNWTVDKLGNAAFGGNMNVGDNLQVNENTYLGPSGGFLRIGQGPNLTLTLVGGGANYVVLTHTLHRVDCNGQGLRYIYTGSFGNTPPIGTVIMIAGPTNHNTLFPRTDVAGSNQSLNGNYGYATVLTYVWMGDLWYTVTYG